MTWSKSTIATPIPPELSSIVSSLGTTVGSISPLLDAVVVLLDTAKIFISGTTDPYAALVSTVLDQVESLVNDTFGTGLYQLSVSPYDIEGPVRYDSLGFPLMTPSRAIQAMIDSFDDRGDSERPQFSSGGTVAAFGLMATANSIDQFRSLIEAAMAVFKIPEWEFTFRQIQRYQAQPAISSERPDWKSLKLNSYEPLSQVQSALLDALGTLRGYNAVADNNIDQLIEMIQGKVETLNGIVQRLEFLINSVSNVTGLYVFNLPAGVGGNARIQSNLRDAFLQGPCVQTEYTMATLFVGGGPSLAPIQLLQDLLL